MHRLEVIREWNKKKKQKTNKKTLLFKLFLLDEFQEEIAYLKRTRNDYFASLKSNGLAR